MAQELGVLTVEDARMVLHTMRQVRSSGLLSPGYFDRLLQRLPRGVGGAPTALHHFKLIADVKATTVNARRCNPDGTGVDPLETPTAVVNWGGLLDDALTDYVGLFAEVDGDWVFVQGPCIT